MPVKEVTNSRLLKEIRDVKTIVTGNSAGIKQNRAAIEKNKEAVEENRAIIEKNSAAIRKNRVVIEKNSIDIKKNGKSIGELLKLHFPLEKRVVDVEERVVLFPEFFNKVDILVAEIIERRPEKALMLARIDDHEKRITTLESK